MERLAQKVPKVSNWPGLLVGDMTQARGGPMLTGHGSHQIGIDADIWLTPMPRTQLSREEREEMSATKVVAEDKKDVDPRIWTPGHFAVIKAAAEDPRVERIFVNAAIKKALCREAGKDRAFLHKVRPWWGHDYHFHVRLSCPSNSPECKGQDPTEGEGCGKDLDYWFSDAILNPPPQKPQVRKPVMMSDLPAACKQVLLAP